jgi:hypothetical protein
VVAVVTPYLFRLGFAPLFVILEKHCWVFAQLMSEKRLFRAQPIHRSPRKDLLGGNHTINCAITYPTIGQQHRIVLRNGLGTCYIVIALVVECLSGILSHKTPWNTSSWSPVAAKTKHVEIGSGCNLSMLLNLQYKWSSWTESTNVGSIPSGFVLGTE